jgi:ribosomal protein L16 Arg81 hydroxylase
MWLLYRRYRKYRKNRIHWVHPINEKREEVGLFYTLFQDLRKDEKKFFNYFRMSITTCDDLHELLNDNPKHQNTKMRNCIQPVQMLAIALR